MHICTPFSRVHVIPELEGKRVEVQVRTERQNRWAQIVERLAGTSVRPLDSLRLANWVGVGCLGQAVGLSIGGEAPSAVVPNWCFLPIVDLSSSSALGGSS